VHGVIIIFQEQRSCLLLLEAAWAFHHGDPVDAWRRQSCHRCRLIRIGFGLLRFPPAAAVVGAGTPVDLQLLLPLLFVRVNVVAVVDDDPPLPEGKADGGRRK